MKRFYKKLRILLFAVSIGLASVSFIRSIYEFRTEIRVNVPQVETEAPIFIVPYSLSENIVDNRDLSLYDFGGNNSFCDEISGIKAKNCEANLDKVRDFIWSHWKDKKRAYIILESNTRYYNAISKDHLFIEPDKNGEWFVRRVEESSDRKFAWGLWISGGGNYRSLEFYHDKETNKIRLILSSENHTYFEI